MRAIYAYNFGYSLLLKCVVNLATRCHYRHIVTHGREHLPTDGPYILAPCHQNALMDPLVLLEQLGGPIVFLARADIFRKPTIRAILTWLRIMPAFRIRDGRDQLGKNAETFDKSVEVLLHNVPLCLMAEGTHNDKHQLRPLVKGMFRIAGEACKKMEGKPLYIVPVGMDYDEYEKPYSSVCVEIGEPIDVRQFMQEFEENEPVALNQMREALTQGLKAVMHHVEATDSYEGEYGYCHLSTQEYLREQKLRNSVWNRYQARKAITRRLATLSDDERAACLAEGQVFADRCTHKGVPLWFASKGWKWWKSVLTLIGTAGLVAALLSAHRLLLDAHAGYTVLGLFVWVLANPIVFFPTHLITRRIIEDPQFRSSINWGIRTGLHIVYFLVLFVVIALVMSLLHAVVLLAIGLLSAWITPHLLALLRDTWYHLKWVLHKPGKVS